MLKLSGVRKIVTLHLVNYETIIGNKHPIIYERDFSIECSATAIVSKISP